MKETKKERGAGPRSAWKLGLAVLAALALAAAAGCGGGDGGEEPVPTPTDGPYVKSLRVITHPRTWSYLGDRPNLEGMVVEVEWSDYRGKRIETDITKFGTVPERIDQINPPNSTSNVPKPNSPYYHVYHVDSRGGAQAEVVIPYVVDILGANPQDDSISSISIQVPGGGGTAVTPPDASSYTFFVPTASGSPSWYEDQPLDTSKFKVIGTYGWVPDSVGYFNGDASNISPAADYFGSIGLYKADATTPLWHLGANIITTAADGNFISLTSQIDREVRELEVFSDRKYWTWTTGNKTVQYSIATRGRSVAAWYSPVPPDTWVAVGQPVISGGTNYASDWVQFSINEFYFVDRLEWNKDGNFRNYAAEEAPSSKADWDKWRDEWTPNAQDWYDRSISSYSVSGGTTVDRLDDLQRRQYWLEELYKAGPSFTVYYQGTAETRILTVGELIQAGYTQNPRTGVPTGTTDPTVEGTTGQHPAMAIVVPWLDDVYDGIEAAIRIQYYVPGIRAQISTSAYGTLNQSLGTSAVPTTLGLGVPVNPASSQRLNQAYIPLKVYTWNGEIEADWADVNKAKLVPSIAGRRRISGQGWNTALNNAAYGGPGLDESNTNTLINEWADEVKLHYKLMYVHTRDGEAEPIYSPVNMGRPVITALNQKSNLGEQISGSSSVITPDRLNKSYFNGWYSNSWHARWATIPASPPAGTVGAGGRVGAGWMAWPTGSSVTAPIAGGGQTPAVVLPVGQGEATARWDGDVNYDPNGLIVPELNPATGALRNVPSGTRGINIIDQDGEITESEFILAVYPFGGRRFGTSSSGGISGGRRPALANNVPIAYQIEP